MRSSLLLLLAACTVTPVPDKSVDTDTDVSVDTEPDTQVITDSEVPGDTEADTDESDVPDPGRVIDCATLPQDNLVTRAVPRARAYHGIAFDQTGGVHGNNSGLLFRADYQGTGGPWATGVGQLEQIDILPNGDIVAGSPSRGGVLRIAVNGSVELIASVNSIYGLRVGPDGMIYTANQSRMHRIDPATGEVEVFLAASAGFVPKAFDWNVELNQMYIGTNGTDGKVWVVDLDADFDPVGVPRVFTRTNGGTWHDAITFDICGNFYVAEYHSSSLYRVTPDGNVSLLIRAPGLLAQAYGHGVVFGTGIGGWPDDALYMPQPYGGNKILEVHVGVPGRAWTGGTTINRQQP